MKFAAVALALATSRALLPEALAESVTCSFTIDNEVQQVWVDGVDVSSSVSGNFRNWGSGKSLTFSGGQVLAVKGYDAENGCTTGGFSIRCTSSLAGSPWNMDSEADRESWLVHASSGAAAPADDSEGRKWYQIGYSAPSGFGVPSAGSTPYAPSIIGKDDMCGTGAVFGQKYWHFLFGGGSGPQTPEPTLTPTSTPTSSPTSSPSSTPTSAPTTAPTLAPTVPGPIEALNLTAVTSDFLTKSAVSLEYDSGVGRAFRYELFKKGCDDAIDDTSLVVASHDVQPKDDSDSLQEVTLTYDFDLAAVENSDIYNSTSTKLEVCSKMEIMVNEIPVFTTEQEIIIDINLEANFALNVTLEEALTQSANDTVDFQNAIRGFKCNTATFDLDPTELAPNEELDICIESTDSTVLIEELVTMKSKQGEGDEVLIVSGGSAEVAAITSIVPPEGPTAQMFVTTRLPLNMFTFAVGEELTVSGSVLLQFASRRLQSERKLRNLQDSVIDAEPQEAAFQVKVDLKQENGIGDEVPMGSSAGYATSKYAAAFGLISMVILNLM